MNSLVKILSLTLGLMIINTSLSLAVKDGAEMAPWRAQYVTAMDGCSGTGYAFGSLAIKLIRLRPAHMKLIERKATGQQTDWGTDGLALDFIEQLMVNNGDREGRTDADYSVVLMDENCHQMAIGIMMGEKFKEMFRGGASFGKPADYPLPPWDNAIQTHFDRIKQSCNEKFEVNKLIELAEFYRPTEAEAVAVNGPVVDYLELLSGDEQVNLFFDTGKINAKTGVTPSPEEILNCNNLFLGMSARLAEVVRPFE